MKTSLRIGRIMGIPINIHFTWLIIIALFTAFFALQSVPVFGFTIGFGDTGFSLPIKLVLGLVVSVLFFACVLAHELGHSYIALKNGYGVKSITLFIFGGISRMEEIPQDTSLELRMALAGPGVSILLGAAFLGVYLGVSTVQDGAVIEATVIGCGALAFYNFLIGLFNLIPAFPADGGRVLRSVLASRKNYQRATEIAASVGKAVAVAMGIVGFFYNWWLILIAVFIYMGASQEERMTEVTFALKGVIAREIMTADVKTVSPEMTVAEVASYMQETKHTGFPVTENGDVKGIVTYSDIHPVDEERRTKLSARDVMSSDLVTVAPTDDAVEAFKKMSQQDIGRILVMRDEQLDGIISRSDIMRAIKAGNV